MAQFKTPLRYPGGKQRLAPFIREIILENNITGHYVEPYAGGAGIAIELLLEANVENVHLNDSYIGIYAFWRAILDHTDTFCDMVLTVPMTVEEWRKQKAILKLGSAASTLDLGFALFYLNRCNRSGVLNGGLIGGQDQSGNYKMDARFPRQDLIKRIELIGAQRDRITVSNLRAEEFIELILPALPIDNSLVYLDPPYYEKGNELYSNSYKKKDHKSLSELIQTEIHHTWVLSYDGVPDIIDLYEKRRHFLYDLQYSAAKVYKGKEVFVFCDRMKLPTICSIKYVDSGLQSMLYPI